MIATMLLERIYDGHIFLRPLTSLNTTVVSRVQLFDVIVDVQ